MNRAEKAVELKHNGGIPAFELMKEIMGDKLIALHSGETVI